MTAVRGDKQDGAAPPSSERGPQTNQSGGSGVNKFLLILLAVSLLGNFYLWRSLQAEGQRADQATAHADQLVNSAQERVSTAAQAHDQMQEMLARVGALASELSQGLDEIKTLTGATEVVSTDLAPPSQSLGEVLGEVSESAGEASEASREMLDEAATEESQASEEPAFPDAVGARGEGGAPSAAPPSASVSPGRGIRG